MIDVRRLSVLLVTVFALTGAAVSAQDPDDEREGGVIGTGIVGTVTELGSIIVNQQRVTFGADTMAASVLGGQKASALTPGDTVVIVAEQEQEVWRATSIEQHYALVGPVGLTSGTLTVLGTPIDLTGATAQAKDLAARLNDGDWIAVSGLWKDDVLVASNLDLAPGQEIAVLSGSYMPTGAEDAFKIGTSEVSGLDLSHVEIGQIVTVTGRAAPNGVTAETVRIGLFSGPLQKVIAQGFMSKPTADGLYTVLGTGAVSFTDQPQMIDTQTVGLYCISPDAGNDGQAAMIPLENACD